MHSNTRATVLGSLFAIGVVVAACESADDPQGSAGAGTSQVIQEARSDKPRDTNPSVSDPAFSELVTGNNQFAFELYQKLATPNANHLCSPLSVSVALAMTWAGARTANESEMAAVLHFTLPQDALHSAMNKLMLELAARNTAPKDAASDKILRLDLVNAAWVQKDYQFVPAYLDTLAVEYGSGINLLDFKADPKGAAALINGWVAEKTEDKIQSLIPDGAISVGTRLVLTNALYFFGNWASPFRKGSTVDAPFHAASGDVTASMMEQTLQSRYAEGDGWQMADLGYVGGETAMTIVLPAAGRFDEIRGAMSAGWLAAADASASSTAVEFGLPKFRFTWGTESLVKPLKALGMVKAFDSTTDLGRPVADFSGMSTFGPPAHEYLYIADVLHKAFIGVDEDGTEAAAATAVIMDAGATDGSVPGTPKHLYADRPFVFLIRDRTTGSLLFVGQVVDPTPS